MKKLLSLLILFCIFFNYSCKKPSAFVYRDLRNFKVNSIRSDRSRVSMDLVFFNPNNYGVNLKNVDCSIYIDSNYVGKFLLDTLMHIPKVAEFSLPASFDVDMKNILKNSLNILLSNEVLVRATGTSRIGKGGIFVTIPFNYEGRQKLSLF